jgi:hypothetical protein
MGFLNETGENRMTRALLVLNVVARASSYHEKEVGNGHVSYALFHLEVAYLLVIQRYCKPLLLYQRLSYVQFPSNLIPLLQYSSSCKN